jgi:WD40 repeat protein
MTAIMKDISPFEILSMCFASEHAQGRTFFIGHSHGGVISVNFRAGVIIHSFQLCDHEINSLAYVSGLQNYVAVGDGGGSLILLKDNLGHLNASVCKTTAVFGGNAGIGKVRLVESMQLIVCCSTKNSWCVWDPHQSSPLVHAEETGNIAGIEVLGTKLIEHTTSEEGRRLLTIAVATTSAVFIYTIDLTSLRCICSFALEPDTSVYITHLSILRKGPSDANYIAPYPASLIIIAYTDDGQVITWDFDSVVEDSENTLQAYFALKSITSHAQQYKSYRLSFAGGREETFKKIYCTNQWKGHHESISACVTLDYYGCFFSGMTATH